MKTYIVYKTTNTRNGKVYYGVHTQNSTKFDGYLGSGKILFDAIQKYGKQAFIRETLKQFDSLEEAYKYEADIVTPVQVADPNCYNIQVGGLGGAKGTKFMQKDGKGIRVPLDQVNVLEKEGWVLRGKSRAGIHTAEWKRKVSEKLKGHTVSQETIQKTLETKRKRGTTTKGRKLTEEHKQKIREGLSRANRGKTLSLETRQKVREAHKGRKGIVKNGKRKNVVPSDLEIYLKDGWKLLKP